MPALRSARDVLVSELKEIYSAERQLSRALPRLSKKVFSEELRNMLSQRVRQGEHLIERLDETLDEMEVTKGRPKNIAMEGLIDDVNQHVEEIEEDLLLDPVLLASMQKIEHYCIAAWGAAAAFGRVLEQDAVVKTMENVLGEGKKFDAEMTRLAANDVNPRIAEPEDADDQEESEGEDKAEDDEEEKSASEKKESGRGRRKTS